MSTRSEEFRVRWAAHPVRRYRAGTQPFHHPVAGDLDLVADPGLTLVACTAPPGSLSRQGLDLLASWAATNDSPFPADQAHPAGQTLWVTEGVGPDPNASKELVELRADDIVTTPPHEEHGHGASPDHRMTHVSVTRNLPGKADKWGAHVTDSEYRSKPA